MTKTRALTLNIAANYVDIEQVINLLVPTNPTSVVVCIDRLEDQWKFDRFRDRLPNTTVICRVVPAAHVRLEDAEYHYPGPDAGYRMSPGNFLARYGHLGKNGKVLYVQNEPDGYNFVPQLVQWNMELVQLAAQQQIRVCILNLGTGHPKDADGAWDRAFDPLLRILAQPRITRWVIIGLHEYHPGWGYRVGRFQHLINSFARLGTPLPAMPRIAITEFGIDAADGNDQQNGYRSRGMTGRDLYNLCAESYNRVYRSLMRAGKLFGIAVFCYGDSGGWTNFNVFGDGGFLDAMRTEFPMEVSPEAAAPVTPAPEPTLPVATRWVNANCQVVNRGGGFIRNAPRSTATLVGQMPRVGVFRADVAQDGRANLADGTWIQVRYNGVQGWTHGFYLNTDAAARKSVTLKADQQDQIDRFLASAATFGVTVS